MKTLIKLLKPLQNIQYIIWCSHFLMTVAIISCSQPQPNNRYVIEGTVSDSTANGRTIFIRSYDTEKNIDSTKIENNRFTFEGVIDTAQYCRIDINNKEFGNVIVEPGHIQVKTNSYQHSASGSPLNDEILNILKMQDSILQSINQKRDELIASYPNPQEQKTQLNSFIKQQQASILEVTRSLLIKHSNDAVGYFLTYSPFIQDIPTEEKWKFLQEMGPWLKATHHIQNLIKLTEKEMKSKVGMPYINVEGLDDKGKKIALADFVGKGNYVLVDIWASWCKPCRAEIPNLAKLYEKYHKKGLTVVGIFTWDKAPNMVKTVTDEKITWPQIVDIESNAADKYGVDGIPFIFLLSPDGVILERDLQGEKMILSVEKYLEK